jgi:hypothetical protein
MDNIGLVWTAKMRTPSPPNIAVKRLILIDILLSKII